MAQFLLHQIFLQSARLRVHYGTIQSSCKAAGREPRTETCPAGGQIESFRSPARAPLEHRDHPAAKRCLPQIPETIPQRNQPHQLPGPSESQMATRTSPAALSAGGPAAPRMAPLRPGLSSRQKVTRPALPGALTHGGCSEGPRPPANGEQKPDSLDFVSRTCSARYLGESRIAKEAGLTRTPPPTRDGGMIVNAPSPTAWKSCLGPPWPQGV